jgi:DNA-binding SARP family transcriptional activator/tetratricopeptide (TPR) repeat protein
MNSTPTQLRLLGPVEIVVDGRPRPVAGLRRRAVLAALGLRPGETVAADRLINVVWADEPPATPSNTLQRHISFLREALGPTAPIVARPPGYALAIAADAVDAVRAEHLIRAASPGASAADLRTALDLWRGEALADLTGLPWFQEQAVRLETLRLDGVHRFIEQRLSAGEHASVIPDLEALVDQHRFREDFHRQLMLALYHSGRQVEALDVFRKLRHTLDDELGIEPSAGLRALEVALLRQDLSTLDGGAQPRIEVETGRSEPRAPAQLPLTTPAFTGRDRELAELDDLVGRMAGGTVVIAAIAGTAGVGKTALAVHWAHRHAYEFPDGQLYANLRGYDPAGEPKDPGEVLCGFIAALGTPPDQIPTSLDEQASLLRTLLAGRRVLVLLDNARDAEQVRPLLPGTPGCLVLVTSRNQLTSLLVTEGALPVSLERPSAAEAHAMLDRRLGTARTWREPAAVDDIVTRCARLPLAIALAAARAAANPRLTLTAVAGELRAALEQLHGGDPHSDLRAVFSWSYQALSSAGAALFRQLGHCPGAEFSTAAAASAAGLPVAEVRPVLAELVRDHMITELRPDRYALHDLLRAYAVELATAHDGAQTWAQARARLSAYYFHSTYVAAFRLGRHREPIAVADPPAAVSVEPFPTDDAALDWFNDHRPLLVRLVTEDPVGGGWRPWQLAWAVLGFLETRGYWEENVAIQEFAVRTAESDGDAIGLAYARRSLGGALGVAGRHVEAYAQTELAAHDFVALGNDTLAAYCHINLGWVAELRGDIPDSLHHVEVAYGLFLSVGHVRGQAMAHNAIAECLAQLGRIDEALKHSEAAYATLGTTGERIDEADAARSLGFVQVRAGDQAAAAALYQRAVQLYHEVGETRSEAETYELLGDAHHAFGDGGAAGAAWLRALTLLQHLNRAESTAAIRAKIAGVRDSRRRGVTEATVTPAA